MYICIMYIYSYSYLQLYVYITFIYVVTRKFLLKDHLQTCVKIVQNAISCFQTYVPYCEPVLNLYKILLLRDEILFPASIVGNFLQEVTRCNSAHLHLQGLLLAEAADFLAILYTSEPLENYASTSTLSMILAPQSNIYIFLKRLECLSPIIGKMLLFYVTEDFRSNRYTYNFPHAIIDVLNYLVKRSQSYTMELADICVAQEEAAAKVNYGKSNMVKTGAFYPSSDGGGQKRPFVGFKLGTLLEEKVDHDSNLSENTAILNNKDSNSLLSQSEKLKKPSAKKYGAAFRKGKHKASRSRRTCLLTLRQCISKIKGVPSFIRGGHLIFGTEAIQRELAAQIKYPHHAKEMIHDDMKGTVEYAFNHGILPANFIQSTCYSDRFHAEKHVEPDPCGMNPANIGIDSSILGSRGQIQDSRSESINPEVHALRAMFSHMHIVSACFLFSLWVWTKNALLAEEFHKYVEKYGHPDESKEEPSYSSSSNSSDDGSEESDSAANSPSCDKKRRLL